MDNSEPESSEDSELYEKLAGEGCLAKKDSFLRICGRYIRGLLFFSDPEPQAVDDPKEQCCENKEYRDHACNRGCTFSISPDLQSAMVVQVEAQLSEAASATSCQSPRSAKSSQ